MTSPLLEAAQKLPIDERIELAEAIWDTIATDADLEVLPLPESHRAELERRLLDLEEHPDDETRWEDVRRERLERRE